MASLRRISTVCSSSSSQTCGCCRYSTTCSRRSGTLRSLRRVHLNWQRARAVLTSDPFQWPLIHPAFLRWPPTPGGHRISTQRLWPAVLCCDLLNFWRLRAKKVKQCAAPSPQPLGANDLPPRVRERYVSALTPAQPFISASFYCTTSSALPRQHVTGSERVCREKGTAGGGMEKRGTKHKDTKKRRRAGRGSRKEETAEGGRAGGGV